MCDFQHLYFNQNGYVVRCNKCNNYQAAFASTVMLLNENDFNILRKILLNKLMEKDPLKVNDIKSIIIPTPYVGIRMLLTRIELAQFSDILEQADNEVKAIALLELFHQ